MPKGRNDTPVYSRNIGFDMKVEYDVNGRQLYVGFAYPGAATSAASWQIYKLGYDSSGRVITRRYADNTDDFTKIWDSNSTYTYTDI